MLPLPVLASLAWDEPAAAVFSHGATAPRRFERGRAAAVTAHGAGTRSQPSIGRPRRDHRLAAPADDGRARMGTDHRGPGMSIDDLRTAGVPDPSDLPLFAPVPIATARTGARRLHHDTHHRDTTATGPQRHGRCRWSRATAAPVRRRPRLGRWSPPFRQQASDRLSAVAGAGARPPHRAGAAHRGPGHHRRAARGRGRRTDRRRCRRPGRPRSRPRWPPRSRPPCSGWAGSSRWSTTTGWRTSSSPATTRSPSS